METPTFGRIIHFLSFPREGVTPTVRGHRGKHQSESESRSRSEGNVAQSLYWGFPRKEWGSSRHRG